MGTNHAVRPARALPGPGPGRPGPGTGLAAAGTRAGAQAAAEVGVAGLPGLGRRRVVVLVGLAGLLLAAVLAGTGAGAVRLSPAEILAVLIRWAGGDAAAGPGAGAGAGPAARILLDIRLPRVLLAGLVGASLAAAGGAFQTLFRNPMADPYVLGVSSGGALGAAVGFILLTAPGDGPAAVARAAGFGLVPVCAFAGAVAAVALVRRLAQVRGRLPVTTLLLAGVAVAALLGALVSLLVYLSGERLRPLVFWLLGSLSGAGWREVAVAACAAAAGLGILVAQSRALNALWLGEEAAYHLGVDVEAVKRRLLVAGSLLTATAVSVSGVIGFVGLMVPHAVRLLVGGDHRVLLPGSVLAGAAVLIACDTVARVVLAPAELPVGVVTALVGAPCFLYLLRTHVAGRGDGGL